MIYESHSNYNACPILKFKAIVLLRISALPAVLSLNKP